MMMVGLGRGYFVSNFPFGFGIEAKRMFVFAIKIEIWWWGLIMGVLRGTLSQTPFLMVVVVVRLLHGLGLTVLRVDRRRWWSERERAAYSASYIFRVLIHLVISVSSQGASNTI